MRSKNTICIWYDNDARAAAEFYASTFPDSKVTAVHKAPSDFPGGKQGDELMVEFTVLGIPCVGLNGGPAFKQTEAFSFQVATDSQEETDRYWDAIVGNGGKESDCGWCKDRWGVSWQITPRVLMDAFDAGGDEAKRAFEAMLTMQKIDVAKIEAARKGNKLYGMKLRLRKAHLLILGIVSLVCSRTVFFLIDDPEGPNLLIVIGLSVVLFILLYMLYVSIIKFGDTVEK